MEELHGMYYSIMLVVVVTLTVIKAGEC